MDGGDLGHGQSHGYLPDDMAFDDLINQSSWPSSATPSNQYPAYQSQTHTPQPTYSPYHPPSQQQPSYHYDLSQQSPAYSQMPYSNSPYSAQPQYQQPQLSRAPSNEYNTTTFNSMDPSLHASHLYQPPSHAYQYPPQQDAHPTISPHSLFANPVSQLHQVNRAPSNSPFQQANGSLNNFDQANQSNGGPYFNNFQYDNIPPSQANPIQYPRIASDTPEFRPSTRPVVEIPYKAVPRSPIPQPPPAPVQPPVLRPSSTLRISRPELLAVKDTTLKHPLNHAPFTVFLNVSGPSIKAVEAKAAKVRKSKVGADDVSLNKSALKKRGRPRKDQSTTGYKGTSRPPKIKAVKEQRPDGSVAKSVSPSESSSEEDSSSEDESEYEDETKLPVVDISTVREAARPIDPVLAAGWDAIGIIWKDPYQNASQEVVSEAVSKYGQFVMGFRNQIKTVMTKIEEAATKPAELKQLQLQQSGLLEALHQTISVTLKLGAPYIVDQLGNHHQLVNALISTLRDCIKANDYTGKLPKATLELLAKFKTLSEDILKKCKFDSVQKRCIKKGDKDTNQKFAEILANTVEAQEKAAKLKKVEGAKKTPDVVGQVKERTAEVTKPAAGNIAKRPLEDASNGKPNKKFAADVPGSTKPNVVKKPTSNLLGIATRPVAKPVVKKREISPPQESKLGALLASIAKPAEVPRAPSAPARTPETPEQKARRERKESRRHLRVKFKEGSELEQVRLFKHEQEEDEGRQDDMLRDATDTHNEGMMHKKRATESMDLDEEDYQPPDVEEPDFVEPKSIDFSELAKSTPYGATFHTRGGDLPVTSQEQKTQERREAVELLVIYTNPDDIPPSAKEPPSTGDDTAAEPTIQEWKQSSIPWHVQRLQEVAQYGSDQAFQIFAAQISARTAANPSLRVNQSNHDAGNASSSQSQNTTLDFSQQPPAHQQIDVAASEMIILFSAVETLKGKSFPPTEPPGWMANPRLRQIWIDGYERDRTAKEQQEAELRLAIQMQAQVAPPPPMLAYNHAPAVPPPQHFQSSAPLQFPPPPPPPQPDMSQHMFPGFGDDSRGPPVTPAFDYNAWAAANAPNGQPNRPYDQPQREDLDRIRRDEDEVRASGKPKKKLKNWERFDENGEYKGPKQPCRFWAIGQCRKGAGCTYSHDQVPDV